MTRMDYENECSLVNLKYQLSDFGDADTYSFVLNNSIRVIQLPTVVKLLTDNRAIIKDFPIDFDMSGMEPYNDYAIKVCDTFGTILYVFVHCRGAYTYLFPVVSGFDSDISCSPMNPTDNWRIRALRTAKSYNVPLVDSNGSMMPIGQTGALDSFEFRDLSGGLYHERIRMLSAKKEFGFSGIMIEVDTAGVYGNSFVLAKPVANGLLSIWEKSEYDSLYDKHTATTFSSAALILQVWLHTVTMWRKRCLNRKIKVVHPHGEAEYTRDIKQVLSNTKQTIVDLNKDIVVYVNDVLTKRELRSYHVTESVRCGHFRHLPNGNIIYIAPTTVHYKKLVPDERLVDSIQKPIVYRNTEDFLREKSYLEDEVNSMLQGRGIAREREKMFDWMGRKRLDFYLPDKNVAIECQGVQHFFPYGSKDSDFQARQQRDIDKYEECAAHGINVLYYVNPNIPIPDNLASKYRYVTDLDELYALIR